MWTDVNNWGELYLFISLHQNGSDISFVLVVETVFVDATATRIIGRPEIVAARWGSCQSNLTWV